MKHVFLMDPLATVNYFKDTTFVFMLEASRRGHDVYYLAKDQISFEKEGLIFSVTKVVPQDNPEKPFEIGQNLLLHEQDVSVVWVRTDPPFDERYLENMWLLERASSQLTIINRPEAVRTVNEKIWALQFQDLIPETVVTSQKVVYEKFLNEKQNVILKPTNGYGGSSIFNIKKEDKNKWVAFETVTRNGKQPAIIQEYVSEAVEGDKRILLLNGEILGAVLRVNSGEDHRNNFFSGGKPKETEITERDKEIVSLLKPHLQKLGLYFVGIDIIGDKLIEVNVTSPTCLQEMNQITGKRLEKDVVDFVENLMKV